jgi:hypothetical protein
MPYSWDKDLKRQQELLSSKHMAKPHLYEVYLTDEELSFLEQKHQGRCRDIAETVLHGCYDADERKKDYMLFDVTEQRPLVVLVGEESKWGVLGPA